MLKAPTCRKKKKTNIKKGSRFSYNLTSQGKQVPLIGPLQLGIHVIQNRHGGEQWDKTNKGN